MAKQAVTIRVLHADGIGPSHIACRLDVACSIYHLPGDLSECNGCERDLGKLAHVDRVLVGRIDKISTLIGNLTLRISNVDTGQTVFALTVSFRGDTDEAWQHAVRFLARDLGPTVTQKP